MVPITGWGIDPNYMGFANSRGTLVGGPSKKDCSIVGSTLGSLVNGNCHIGIL